jgi:lactate permease
LPFSQVYDPFGSPLFSTLAAALPVLVLLGALGIFRVPAHYAALLGLAVAATSALAFGMPVPMVGVTAVYGAAYGLLPIGWIVLNVIFLYTLASEKGLLQIVQDSMTSVTRDRRLQLLLIAFCFGAFFEGAAGFGTPVAVTAAILIGLGFSPLAASGLSLIANTAPVPFAALGTPLLALQGVTNLDLLSLSAMVGRLLSPFALIVPFWMIWAYVGFRKMIEVWPALLVAGGSYAITQLLVSNLHGPWLAALISALVSMFALVAFLLRWKPRRTLDHDGSEIVAVAGDVKTYPRGELLRAWLPWVVLSAMIFIWSLPAVKTALDGPSIVKIAVPGLHNLVLRVPPVVTAPTPEAAVFSLNWLSATGSGILAAAIVAGVLMGYRPTQMADAYWRTIKRVRFSLLTIAAMMALGFVTRYGGLDATMGLTFAKTGPLYPFFGTLLGWLGVAVTGSDTSSNVLFGSLQRISAEQLGLSAVLMAAANSAGGVMGKMIDAQSIVVASTATRWYGHEGSILRFVFVHSIALAALVGIWVTVIAYVLPVLVP